MKTHLKIKIKSLIAERKIIKAEMKKWGWMVKDERETGIYYTHSPMWESLNHHELDLHSQVRHSNIAYGFLRGRKYQEIENICYTAPLWNKVKAEVYRFGADQMQGDQRIDRNALMDKYKVWQEEAEKLTTPTILYQREECRQVIKNVRRAAYKAKYWRPDQVDLVKLKDELRAKWDAKKAADRLQLNNDIDEILTLTESKNV